MKPGDIHPSVPLEAGLYTNVFEAEVPTDPVTVMIAEAKLYPNLQLLRDEIEHNCWKYQFYRIRDRIFGYGDECATLMEKSFRQEKLLLQAEPDLCKHLILKGLSKQLREKGYREGLGRGRVTLYEPKPYRNAAGGKLQVYRGYDLRSIWWSQESQVRFGIVVDVRWEIQDERGNRLSAPEIAGYKAMSEIGQIQEELLSNGKINTEVARLRLQNHILPWVREHSRFSLPCGGEVTISTTPVRVIIGA